MNFEFLKFDFRFAISNPRNTEMQNITEKIRQVKRIAPVKGHIIKEIFLIQ